MRQVYIVFNSQTNDSQSLMLLQTLQFIERVTFQYLSYGFWSVRW